jgi:hypothetical protein
MATAAVSLYCRDAAFASDKGLDIAANGGKIVLHFALQTEKVIPSSNLL